MPFLRIALLCAALIASASSPLLAEDSAQGDCAGQADCVPPVYVDPDQPPCEGEDCTPHPAITCEGEDCLQPQDNPVQSCEGQDCLPSEDGPLEECEGQDCELAPPAE